MRVLVLNSGSATQKIAVVDATSSSGCLKTETLWERSSEVPPGAKRSDIILAQLRGLNEKGGTDALELDVIGHRVVHGGEEFKRSTFVDRHVVESVARLSKLAPIHNPPAVEGMECVLEIFKTIPQVAVFDTSFHTTLPDAFRRYAVPAHWYDQLGVRKFGFHGISHEYCYRRCLELPGMDEFEALDGRAITCHLGGGSSLAGIKNGRCIDTTMGFTPLDGVVMSTRPGSLDPGIITHVARVSGASIEELGEALNRESGIRGVTGLSGDMQELLAEVDRGNQSAILALDMFIVSVRKHIASLAASLGGVDLLAFTGGIGENSAIVRETIVHGLDFLGIEIDRAKNQGRGDRSISISQARVHVAVIHADESSQIARECYQMIHEEADA